MDSHELTVNEFSRFVAATNYQSEAEKFGWSGVFDMKAGEWRKAEGASWRHPDGPGSEPKTDEPLCQVSGNDANPYAKWAGQRLPTEVEWESAARGGLVGKKCDWGDELRLGGRPVANWWQGHFPEHDTGEDASYEDALICRQRCAGNSARTTTGNG